jgi:hypothetical protein
VPVGLSYDHDLFGVELDECVVDRLQWIGVTDTAVRLDPRSAETLEGGGEAKVGSATGFVLVGQPVPNSRIKRRRDHTHFRLLISSPHPGCPSKYFPLDDPVQDHEDPAVAQPCLRV